MKYAIHAFALAVLAAPEATPQAGPPGGFVSAPTPSMMGTGQNYDYASPGTWGLPYVGGAL